MRMGMTAVAAILGVLALGVVAGLSPSDARGGHLGGFGSHHGRRGGFGGNGTRNDAFAGDQRHGNDDYVKAASQEEDKLLPGSKASAAVADRLGRGGRTYQKKPKWGCCATCIRRCEYCCG